MATVKITSAVLERLAVGETIWDSEIRGFGARRTAQGVRFQFKGRLAGKQVMIRMERWSRDGLGIPEARRKATDYRLMLSKGEDPRGDRAVPSTMTVRELCDAYLRAAPTMLLPRKGRPRKESTIATDASRIRAHIVPLLGDRLVADLRTADVEAMIHRIASGETAAPPSAGRHVPVRGGEGSASRTLATLSAILGYAVKHHHRDDNPCKGVIGFAYKERDRRLSADEYRALARGLRVLDETRPVAAACLRFLALSGWRAGEARKLRWSEIDIDRRTARLRDTKTDKSMRPLAYAALDVILSLPRLSSEYVFPSSSSDGPISELTRPMMQAVRAGGLPDDVTCHVLRHSVASVGDDLGLSEAAIAALLGHRLGSITSRYVHSADATLLAAADRVADAVLEQMGERKQDSEKVIAMRA